LENFLERVMINPITTRESPEAKATNPGPGSWNEPRPIRPLRKQIEPPMTIQIIPSFVPTRFIDKDICGKVLPYGQNRITKESIIEKTYSPGNLP
jgi:hypothetical protein